MRGRMSDRRRDTIRRAFGKLDVSGDGFVDVEDIALCFNPRESADVKTGKKTERQVLLVGTVVGTVLSIVTA